MLVVLLSKLPIVEAHSIVCSPFCFSFLVEAVEAEAAEVEASEAEAAAEVEASEEEVAAEVEASEEEVAAEAVDAEASEEAAVDGKFVYCLLQAEEQNLSGKPKP